MALAWSDLPWLSSLLAFYCILSYDLNPSHVYTKMSIQSHMTSLATFSLQLKLLGGLDGQHLPEKVRRFYTQITEWREAISRSNRARQTPHHLSCLDLGRAQNAGPTESAPLRTTRVPEPEQLGPGSSAQGRPLIVPGGTT